MDKKIKEQQNKKIHDPEKKSGKSIEESLWDSANKLRGRLIVRI